MAEQPPMLKGAATAAVVNNVAASPSHVVRRAGIPPTRRMPLLVGRFRRDGGRGLGFGCPAAKQRICAADLLATGN